MVESLRRFRVAIALLAALLGFLASTYAVQHHQVVRQSGASGFGCNLNEYVSCDDVARSDYSELFSVPLGSWGQGFFAAILVMILLGLSSWLSKGAVTWALRLWTAGGLAVCLGLAIISFVVIKKGCLICITVYAAVAWLTATVWLLWERPDWRRNDFAIINVLGGIVVVVISAWGLVVVEEEGTAAKQPQTLMLSENQDMISVSTSAYMGKGEDFRIGPDNAKVVIHKFSDFQCPACRRMATILKRVVDTFSGQVQVVYRNFPLDNTCNSSVQRSYHESACIAATLARCAGLQGQFWPFHDLVFLNQRELTPPRVREMAASLGLSDSQIDSCLKSNAIRSKVENDIETGLKLGVSSTPTIFVNGRKFFGSDYQSLKSEIEKLLGSG